MLLTDDEVLVLGEDLGEAVHCEALIPVHFGEVERLLLSDGVLYVCVYRERQYGVTEVQN
jgi:hypothetical protein